MKRWSSAWTQTRAQSELRPHENGTDLVLSIRDDGVGGADSSNGSGLIGLIDRVEALGGHMQIASPPGGGTALHVAIPISA
jgi:signal transduction histidine kinase